MVEETAISRTRGSDPRVVTALVVGVLVVLYLLSPDGSGQIAFFAAATGGVLTFTIGPLILRPKNWLPWRWLMSAGVLFLAGLLLRLEVVDIPGIAGNADIWALSGYACAGGFVRSLLAQTLRGHDRMLWLDTAAVTTGSMLIGWVMSIAPAVSSGEATFWQAVVSTAYPVMDALLVTLSVQLAFRRGVGNPALEAVVVGMTGLLIGDLAYTVILALHPGAVNPYANAVYMVAYAAIGFTAAHPSMRELSDVQVEVQPRVSRPRMALILIGILVPASVPIMLPTRGLVDAVVRALLMMILGSLVFVRILRTIRALQQAEVELHARATHDLLTGLPNRLGLLEHLERQIRRDRSSGGPEWINLLLIDCDDFKQINDSWGNSAGNEVLLACRDRIRETVGPGAAVNRIGGDEFTVIVNTADEPIVNSLAEKLVQAFQQPIVISQDRRTLLTVTVGIARASSATLESAEDLMLDADIAMYSAKEQGGACYAVFDAPMKERVARRRLLTDELRRALKAGTLTVNYQPIRAGEDYSELVGWEALVRWIHPELGTIPPLDFIPIAEDSGLVVDLGEFVLREAADQLRRWQQQFERPDLHMAVNVSSVQLERVDLVALVSDVLESMDLTPGSLWIEITESVQLERSESALANLVGLNRLGVTVCLDDFGTGYSSLSYIKDFTVGVLKIDRTFVKNLVDGQRDRKITKAIVDLSQSLNLQGVVAEGVEDAEQSEALSRLGCTMVQGYFFGRPAPADEATSAAREALLAGVRGSHTPAEHRLGTDHVLPRQRVGEDRSITIEE